jgi:hypothetical protein
LVVSAATGRLKLSASAKSGRSFFMRKTENVVAGGRFVEPWGSAQFRPSWVDICFRHGLLHMPDGLRGSRRSPSAGGSAATGMQPVRVI